MADEDIYGNRKRYERRVSNIHSSRTGTSEGPIAARTRYRCQNLANLAHFERIHRSMDAKDLSYIRRNRIFDALTFITHVTDKELSTCDRDDIDLIVAASHRVNRSPESKKTFLRALKWIWRVLFPETDERGRIDDDATPYAVRHVRCSVHRSRQVLRNDRLSLEELERIVAHFGPDPQMQAYITLAIESLGRPQEICSVLVGDVEQHENYAQVWVRRGKEGAKFLHCIDSYPYVMKWLAQHPHQADPTALLFCARAERDRPLTPFNINKKLRAACARLSIDKRITAYSLKRNGVTFCRLRGEPDVEIQHKAGWTSTRQLRTYDLSTPEDSFRARVARRGLSSEGESIVKSAQTRVCACGSILGFSERFCGTCKRSTDARQVKKDLATEREIREVLSMALEQPDRSLASIMVAWRKESRDGDNTARIRGDPGPGSRAGLLTDPVHSS